MEPLLISPEEFLQQKELALIDIRPPEERWGEYGFIPGSLSVPMREPWTRLHVPEDVLAAASGVVLVCMSGHRAKLAWRSTLQRKPVLVLDGGALAWSATGLPLAGRSLSSEIFEGADSFETLYQALRACFVAEWIESNLNQGTEDFSDPVRLFALCFEAEQVTADSWTHASLRRVLDRLARLSLRAGTEYRKVATNLSVMLNTLSLVMPQGSNT